jgi:hypothetical protein
MTMYTKNIVISIHQVDPLVTTPLQQIYALQQTYFTEFKQQGQQVQLQLAAF